MNEEKQFSEKDYHEMLSVETPENMIERNIYTKHLQSSQNRTIRESIMSQQMIQEMTKNGLDDIDKIFEREFKLLENNHKLEKMSLDNLADSLTYSRTVLKNEQKDS